MTRVGVGGRAAQAAPHGDEGVSTVTTPPDAAEEGDLERWSVREWLVTNGLGGYAAGTVGGVATRRYHGLLTAALPAPRGQLPRDDQRDLRRRSTLYPGRCEAQAWSVAEALRCWIRTAA